MEEEFGLWLKKAKSDGSAFDSARTIVEAEIIHMLIEAYRAGREAGYREGRFDGEYEG